jgi:hypothetical protein
MKHYEEIRAIYLKHGYSEAIAADIATRTATAIEEVRKNPAKAQQLLGEVGEYSSKLNAKKAYEIALEQADELIKAIETVLKAYIIDSGFNHIKVALKAKYVALINQYAQKESFDTYDIAKAMADEVVSLMATVPVEKTVKQFRSVLDTHLVETAVREHVTAIEESTEDSLDDEIDKLLEGALGDIEEQLKAEDSETENDLSEEFETLLNERHKEVVTHMVNSYLQQKKAYTELMLIVQSSDADFTTKCEMINKYTSEAVKVLEAQVLALCAPTYKAWAQDKAPADLAGIDADRIIRFWYDRIFYQAQTAEIKATVVVMPAVDQAYIQAKANTQSLNQLFAFYKQLKSCGFTKIMDKDLDTIITQHHGLIELGKGVQYFYKQLPAEVLEAAEMSATQEEFVSALRDSDSVPTNGTLSALPRLSAKGVMSLSPLADLYEQQQSARAAHQASVGRSSMFSGSAPKPQKDQSHSPAAKPM